MLSEALGALACFDPIRHYSYKGFGSTYFSDFSLFHRHLGISKMDSIEQDEFNRSRFEFNKPLSCIKLWFGKSTNILPQLDWSDRTVVWLDYDGKLNPTVFADIAVFCGRARSGSVLLISVNARPEQYDNGRRAKLEAQLRIPYKVPRDITDLTLGGWGKAQACRRIIYNEIVECMARTNAGLPADKKRNYVQLVNFHYKDSAEMLTTGGIIFSEAERRHFECCGFDVNYNGSVAEFVGKKGRGKGA
jgi:hypothetical protein